jgi:hypothetical protein
MRATPQSDPDQAEEALARSATNAFIGRQVVETLGSPHNLLKVQVNPLGSDHYRVNVIVGKNLASARVGDSFFLTADEEGNIVASSPKIVPLY